MAFGSSYQETNADSSADEWSYNHLCQPPQLNRVGASIGHKSPTLHGLLSAHVPGFVKDEEDGIMAMFAETHRKIRETTPRVSSALRKTLERLWDVWNKVTHSTEATAAPNSASTTSSRSVEDEFGFRGMWKDMHDLVNSSPAQSSEASDAKAYLDALLANMLHTFAQAKDETTSDSSEPESSFSREPAWLSREPAWTLATPPDEDDDTSSLRAFYRQVSQKFPSIRSVKEVEWHLLERLQQISQESQLQKVEEILAEEEFEEDDHSDEYHSPGKRWV